jgi:hypothetical protein
MKFKKPNFDFEWDEALRYREFEDMGKEGWINLAKNGYMTKYSEIKDVLGNVDLDFDTLEEPKKERFKQSIKLGKMELPIVVKFSDEDYDLIAGNTRLSGLIGKGVDAPLWVVDLTKVDLNEDCWKGYKQVGGKIKNGKNVPNCVPIKKSKTNESEEVDGNQKIDKDLGGNQQDMVYGIVDIVKKIEDIKNRESVANDMIKKFKEENIDFNYNEFLKMCGLGKKQDTNETDSGSSGSFEGPLFSDSKVIKRPITTIHNANLNETEEEVDEATDSSSSGQYDVPAFGKTTKGGRRDPLKIDGPDSVYKGRAVKDKKFPKWGGPGGVFVKVKEKCKKYPYCNQGNTGALEFIKENETIKNAITEASKKYGIPYKEIEKIVINDISKIFI